MKKMFVLYAEGESKNVLLARITDCLQNDVEEGNRYFCKVEFYSEYKTISDLIAEMRDNEKKSHEDKE